MTADFTVGDILLLGGNVANTDTSFARTRKIT